jgi:hypothetical protein
VSARPLPEQIQIGRHEFTVRVCRLDDCWGRVRCGKGEIEISDELTLARQWECLGHEIVHVWLHEADLAGIEAPLPVGSEQICSLIGHQFGAMMMRGEVP